MEDRITADPRESQAQWICNPIRNPQSQRMAATGLPAGFVDEAVVEGLQQPVAMTASNDGRFWVCQQGGSLRIVAQGKLLAKPFTAVTVDAQGERGLLGVALDPDFPVKPWVYAYYTATSPNVHNRVSRFTVSPTDSNLAVPGSEAIVIDLPTLSSATNHNGGALRFGADGQLYIAVGDNANPNQAQSLGNLFGKILRLKRDGTLPSDNPFMNRATGMQRAIWALGLRNPFTMNFDAKGQRLFVNEVGQDAWEEINVGKAGGNFGWPLTEGDHDQALYERPLATYGHGEGCAITGGALYPSENEAFPAEYRGDYFYTDYCGGWVRAFDTTSRTSRVFATGITSPLALQVGPDGALYYLSGSALRRIRYAPNAKPRLVQEPADTLVRVGNAAILRVKATGLPPLAYQWFRNGEAIAGASVDSLTLAGLTLGDSGSRFRVRVSDAHGDTLSREALVGVTTNHAPDAVIAISLPGADSLYAGGDTLRYAGSATDSEDGTLGAAALTWRIDFHHESHTHPFVAEYAGASQGLCVLPDQGEISTDVRYRIHLWAADARGAVTHVYRDVHPRIVNWMVSVSPSFIPLRIDGQPAPSIDTIPSVAGMLRSVAVPASVVVDGKIWRFKQWNDGGDSSHAVRTPRRDSTLTAVFEADARALFLEAESATRSGLKVKKDAKGYTGQGYALFSVLTTGRLDFKATAQEAGDYQLIIRYSNPGKAQRSLRILVNGKVVVKSQKFPATEASAWSEVTLPIVLNTGANPLRLAATGKAAPLIDHVRVE